MPSAVKGLMKAGAPCLPVAPCGNNKQSAILATRYCAYIPKVRVATRRPTHAIASAPAAITTPAPSLPTSIPPPPPPPPRRGRERGHHPRLFCPPGQTPPRKGSLHPRAPATYPDLK